MKSLKTIPLLKNAQKSYFQLSSLNSKQKNKALFDFKNLILKNKLKLINANKLDLKNSNGKISDSLFSRLELTADKINSMCHGIEDLIQTQDPIGRIQKKTILDKRLVLERISAPLGVIGIVFESRPDVIPQILTLALKSANAVILKGGKEAKNTNHYFMRLISALNRKNKFLPPHWAQYVGSRNEFQDLLKYPEYVNLIIPRGSKKLIKEIQEKTAIPVLGHADGICHLYVHKKASIVKSIPLILDAKAQYPSACNALETLLVDQWIAQKFLPLFYKEALKNKLQLKGCALTRRILPNIPLTKDKDYFTEWGNLTLCIRIVKSLDEACAHIEKYGSRHTDGILTEDKKAQLSFIQNIDSANVFVNASTRFADGYRYGFGAEVGISTSKLHARGPVGIEGLTTYKYILKGNGQKVSDYTGKQAKKFQHKKVK